MSGMSRREFLRAGAGAWVGRALLAGAAAGAEGRPRRRMTMDLSCGMLGVRASLPEAIALAHRYGFESVAPDPGHLAKLSDAELKDLLAGLEAKGLVFGAAGLPVDFRRDEARFRAGLERLDGYARGLERAGIARVATWLRPTHDRLTYLQNFRLHARRLREVARRLRARGIRLGLEYVGPRTSWAAGRFPFIHTMVEMKELIAEIGLDNVGFLLDSWHWYTAHETEADLLSLRGRDCIAVHLNDAPAGIPVDEQIDSRRALPASTGVIDARTFLRALVRIGYDGPVSAEPFDRSLRKLPPEEAVARAAKAMKRAFALIE